MYRIIILPWPRSRQRDSVEEVRAGVARRRCGEGVLSSSSRRCCSSIFACTKSWCEEVKARMLLIYRQRPTEPQGRRKEHSE